MTTPTPTGSDAAGASPDAPAPPGLPDATTLARWANEFFASPLAPQAHAAEPTAAPVVPAKLPETVPPSTFAPLAVAADALARLSAADLSYPALPPVPAMPGFGVPGAFSPAALPGASAPSYYFLESSSAAGAALPAATAPAGHRPFEVNSIRRDFPILQEKVHGRPLIWFDNAATTQKPAVVIERLDYFYRHENSNIHRAAHELAARATDAYESARREVQRFLGASSPDEIIFVRGATEAINLVAQSWGRQNVREGDEILISHLEHHANIVPWQQLVKERGAKLKVVPVDSTGQLDLTDLRRLLTDRTKLVSITHVSNALGTVTPVEEIAALGHRVGARVLIDGAQSVSHIPVDMQALDADFYVFSGHKVFGPTGIGALYGKAEVLEDMPPWQGGGNMIEDVTFERTLYQPPPGRFEAGTGNIADAVGLGAALKYLQTIGMPNIERYEAELLAYATPRLKAVPGLSLVGTAAHKASVLSFVIEGIDPVAIGSALNQEGIAVRAGHHCAQPILRRFGYEATVRASLAFYNTCQEVDALVRALYRFVGTSGSPAR
jgi:cysteine desulfurase/selenocysteine lyase